MNDFLLSYDTVTLRPKRSELASRMWADTSLDFCGWKCKLPVVPANMVDSISVDNARWMARNGYFYIYHRFGGVENNLLNPTAFVDLANKENWPLISISIGVGYHFPQYFYEVKNKNQRIDFFTIDVAHAHHENVKSAIEYVRRDWPEAKLIAGNVATTEGVEYLARLGVDAVKVGIGGGSICTTRYMTGFHIPTLHSVMEASQVLSDINCDIPIIADGGAKHYGDIAKALTFGASMVMSGGWFASCIDSPAKIKDGKKIYRGSTSYDMKKNSNRVEGRTLELAEGLTYADRLKEITQALQSSISYAGGIDLGAFNSVQWERILP